MCKINGYKIPKFCLNIESLPMGRNEFSLNIAGNIMIPKDKSDDECVAEINVDYEAGDGNNILSVIIRGNIIGIDSNLEDEEKCDLIKKEVFPILYSKLRGIIANILKNINVELPNIPPVEKVKL